jgi:hypothetical protein
MLFGLKVRMEFIHNIEIAVTPIEFFENLLNGQ